MPVIVSVEDATIRDPTSEQDQQEEQQMWIAQPEAELSSAERDIQMFGWRYPALYDYMIESGGKEDLVMTAARILDQISPTIREELIAKEKLWEAAKDVMNPASRNDQDVLYTEVIRLRFLAGAREQARRFLEDDVGKRAFES